MKIISYIIGIGIVITGIFGFFGNPFGLLDTNIIQNIIYVIFGLILLMATMKGKTMLSKIIGIIFVILGILGFVMSGYTIINLVQDTNGGNWFHLIAGIVILLITFMNKSNSHESPMSYGGDVNSQQTQQQSEPPQHDGPQM